MATRSVYFYVLIIAAIFGLLTTFYHAVFNDGDIVLSGYFQTSLLFLVLAAIHDLKESLNKAKSSSALMSNRE